MHIYTYHVPKISLLGQLKSFWKVYSCNNLFSYSYTIIRIFLQWPIVLEWYVLKNTLEPKCIVTVDMMSHHISSTSTTTILFRPLLDRAEHTRSSLPILSTKFDFIYLWYIYQVSDLEVGRRDTSLSELINLGIRKA